MNLESFHFLRPLWLLAAPLAWLLIVWFYRRRQLAGSWQSVVDAELQPYIINSANTARERNTSRIMLLTTTLAAIALAGPVWEREPVPVFRGESALVIALDLSRSMTASDLEPTRLARAKFKIADLLELRQDGQSALIVFAAHSFVVTPLTEDVATLTAQLRGLDTSIMPSQGSEPALALKQAGELLHQAGIARGDVLLVTDGGDAASIERAAKVAASGPFNLHVLGIGSAAGAPIPDSAGGFVRDNEGNIIMSTLARKALQSLASTHGGSYSEVATDDTDINKIAARIDSGAEREAQQTNDLAADQWREFGPWLVLLITPLAAFAFRRGVLFALLLACSAALPPPASADFWLNPDQAGAKAFAGEDYESASELFEHEQWRAAAGYRAGDYESALAGFAEGENATAHYNRGNALARMGRYEEALSAYDSALEQQPAHADAEHNRDLIKQLLAEQEPPPSEQPSDDQQQSEGDEKQDEDAESDGDSSSGGGQGSSESEQSLSDSNAMGGGEPEDGTPSGEQNASAKPSDSNSDADSDAASESEDSMSEDEQARAAQLAEGSSESEQEKARATEQWLRQIPDDPGGLLRRKFQYQYKHLYGDSPYAGNRW